VKFDPRQRALEKQASRDEDARALASGEKTVEQLRAENGAFAFPRDRIRIDINSVRRAESATGSLSADPTLRVASRRRLIGSNGSVAESAAAHQWEKEMLQSSKSEDAPVATVKIGAAKAIAWHRADVALRNVKVVSNGSSKVVTVNAKLAAEWLALNKSNRPLYKAQVATFARDMRAGRWITNTSDAIMIGSNGILLNGQHRLAAVVEAGRSVDMLVEFGADPSSVPAIDRGKGRSALDSYLMSSGKSKTRFWGGVARSASSGANGTRQSMTTQESEAFFDAHEKEIDYAVGILEQARKGIKRSSVAAVFARAMSHVAKAKLDEFGEVLTSGIAPLKSHAIIMTLRDWLLSHPSQGSGVPSYVVYRKTARALLAFVNGERIKTLYEISEEPFPYPGETTNTKLRHKRSKVRSKSR